MRPNGGWSSSGTQNMQSSTGQYSTQAGDPAQPVQHSVITASSLGRFLRGVAMPSDLGSILTTAVAIKVNYTPPRGGAWLAPLVSECGSAGPVIRRAPRS